MKPRSQFSKASAKTAISHVELNALLFLADTSKAEFARLIGVEDRSVRRWCDGSHPVPVWAARLAVSLQHLSAKEMTEFELRPWMTLGLDDPDASLNEAQAARIKLIKSLHPDRATDETDRIRRELLTKRINAAFDEFKRECA
jgi:DNA-binding transcriptional regulator YdaS (Cro superfamily)